MLGTDQGSDNKIADIQTAICRSFTVLERDRESGLEGEMEKYKDTVKDNCKHTSFCFKFFLLL